MAAEAQTEFLKVESLKKWFDVKSGKKLFRRGRGRQFAKAVDGVSFSLREGEVLGIIGESGCGKSTLGNLIAALETPTSGSIALRGAETFRLLKENPEKFRSTVQIIFQNPFDTFVPGTTIQKILFRALKLHHIGRDRTERYELCRKALEDAGLRPADDFLSRFPFELSGGQLQRVSIIRSMLLGPKLLIADEPVSMLDISVRAEIIGMLQEMSRRQGAALVFISHDIVTTRYISDRIAVMYLGRIVETGPTDEVIRNPLHPYTQALISNCASIDPEEAQDRIVLTGEPPSPVGEKKGCYFAPRCFAATDRCLEQYPEQTDEGNGHCVSCWNCGRMPGTTVSKQEPSSR